MGIIRTINAGYGNFFTVYFHFQMGFGLKLSYPDTGKLLETGDMIGRDKYPQIEKRIWSLDRKSNTF